MRLPLLALLLLLALSGPALAMTPALIEPASIAGPWALASSDGVRCTLVLSAEPLPGTIGFHLDARDCGAALAGVTHWRTGADGITLARGDEHSFVFLSRERSGDFSGLDRQGRRWTLRRNAGL